MKVMVTGAGGYIGRRVVAALEARGDDVIAAARRPVAGWSWYPFDLGRPSDITLPAGTQLVIHLAADTSGRGMLSPASEIASAQALADQSKAADARLVFVSSQTAREDAPTDYGRTKWRIERIVLEGAGVVVRPGQVYGGAATGLFGTLVGLVRRLPLLPALLPAPSVQPVHVDDLAQAIVAAGAAMAGATVFQVGEPEPVSFTEFLRAIAQHRLRRWRLFVPVPVVLIELARRASFHRVDALERLGSLLALQPMDTRASLDMLGLCLRPLAEGMQRTHRPRRTLLAESRAVLRYVLGTSPRRDLVMRHARAVEAVREAEPLGLPDWALRRPAWLRLLESPSDLELAWRLDSATALAEATPQGAALFLRVGQPTGPARAVLGLSSAVLTEVFWLCVRTVLPRSARQTRNARTPRGRL
ncbi:hypothetical protein RD110_04325 [Rhodoferax koreense]|uniref:NAD-dependent epimerase/dehydratase domain-containing protein n=1 Tax=Rhodoferax koreensis TaxID=1842727 RepID=A0A1P8JRY2_9BURK|nr:NAD-dependent epimerase/dehydratase family protein [Rhodoferax koreense]APW36527.1 hypothetical protein RD110_04325 [Rhodoferax koreense]